MRCAWDCTQNGRHIDGFASHMGCGHCGATDSHHTNHLLLVRKDNIVGVQETYVELVV